MVKRKLAILTALLISMTLIVSCAAKENTIKTEVNDSENEIDEVVMCESFDINTGFTPVFDVYKGWGCFYYLGNFYETLVNYDNGEIVPGLATSWEIKGKEITFKLRKGVKFMDGTDFNAKVVKKNFDMIPKIMAKEYVSSVALLTKIQEVEVLDDYTVKIKLKEPHYSALQELTGVRPMGIMSVNAYTEEGLSDEVYSKTFGTGKYWIENAVQGEAYTFLRNENYWGEKPKVKKFIVKTIPDMESRIMALRAGEIDMVFGANNINYDTFSEIKKDNRFLAKASDCKVKTRKIVINTTKAPFDDINVRRAVQHAVDKQLICDNLFSGIEEKADYLFNSDLPYCDISLKAYAYDTSKAKELLDKAGWLEVEGKGIREKNGKGLEAEMLYQASTGIEEDIALTIAAQLKEIGFDIHLKGLDHMASASQAMNGNFVMFITLTYGIPYEPHTDIGNMNTFGWHYVAQQGLSKREEINSKINELSNMSNQDKIQETYDYILTTLHNKAVYLPISYKKELVLLNKAKIKDYQFNGQPLNIDVSGIIPN